MEKVPQRVRFDKALAQAGDRWLVKLCLTVFGVVVLFSNGVTAGDYGAWNEWDIVGTDKGWHNVWPTTVMDTSGWQAKGWHEEVPKYKVRTVTRVVKKVPKKVTHTYTTYEDDHEPWISLHVNKRLRKPTIVLNGWAKDGKFGLNVNIH